MKRTVVFFLFGLLPLNSQAPRKRVLAWADTTTGYQHDSISHALAVMDRLGREGGAYDMYIRTCTSAPTRSSSPSRRLRSLRAIRAI
jgi:hypothetical protein